VSGFSESAELYDLIYSRFKDYEAEAAAVAALLGRVHPGARTLLDVGCGTGEHARILRERFGYELAGIDLSPEFVAVAARKSPLARFECADMVDFELGRRFDAVLCLFSSIGYVRTLENVRRALACFRRHLAPGGVVVVEPWFEPGAGALTSGRTTLVTAESDDVKVCRASRLVVEERLSRIEFEYLVARPGGIEHLREVHELGLFTVAETLDCFDSAGLAVEHEATGLTGRGLYLARAQP
jgi:SAM-dependent methyltransferase